MNFKKTVAIVLTSAVLLAGCTIDKKEIKKYDDQVQKAMDQEKTVNQVSKKINELEEKKQKLFKKVNDKDQSTRKKAAEDIVENVKQRQKEFEKEENVKLDRMSIKFSEIVKVVLSLQLLLLIFIVFSKQLKQQLNIIVKSLHLDVQWKTISKLVWN